MKPRRINLPKIRLKNLFLDMGGLSLIEVMVSMAILAIMSIAVSTMMNNTQNQLNAQLKLLKVQQLYNSISQLLSSAACNKAFPTLTGAPNLGDSIGTLKMASGTSLSTTDVIPGGVTIHSIVYSSDPTTGPGLAITFDLSGGTGKSVVGGALTGSAAFPNIPVTILNNPGGATPIKCIASGGGGGGGGPGINSPNQIRSGTAWGPNGTVSFAPSNFTTGCSNVVTSLISGGPGQVDKITINWCNASGFNYSVVNQDSTPMAHQFSWVAFGY